nr:hypothetical protein [Tissierella sp.]
MLTYINREILDIKEKLREYHKLKSLSQAKTEELRRRKLQMENLKNILDKERKDVEKLEGLSMSSIFSNLLGNKYEKIDKEKEEYLLAKLKFEDAREEINKLEKEVNSLNSSLEDYKDIDRKYEKLIREKEELIIKEGGVQGIRLKNLIMNIEELKIDIKEVKEAIVAGEKTLNSLKGVKEKLQSAKSWGTWDMLGGGLISNIGKHSAIDDANKIAKDVQDNLSSFKKELSDVNEFTDIQVNLSSFASFADFFLDGIFADWFVQTKINNSLDNVKEAIKKIQDIVNDLRKNLTKLEEDAKDTEAEFKKFLEV